VPDFVLAHTQQWTDHFTRQDLGSIAAKDARVTFMIEIGLDPDDHNKLYADVHDVKDPFLVLGT
jgi:hypothetical protein